MQGVHAVACLFDPLPERIVGAAVPGHAAVVQNLADG
jgi:hypothetical protein